LRNQGISCREQDNFFFNFKIDQQINVFPYHRYWYSIQLRERSVQTTIDIEDQSA